MNDGDVLRERMRGGTSPILPSTLPVPFGAPVSCCLSPSLSGEQSVQCL